MNCWEGACGYLPRISARRDFNVYYILLAIRYYSKAFNWSIMISSLANIWILIIKLLYILYW